MASVKTLFVDCPLCGGRLEVNAENGKVINHWKKEDLAASSKEDAFTAALKKQKEAKEKLDQYFKQAPQNLEEQKKKLNEHFKEEKKRIYKEKDFSRPDTPFDLD